MLAVSGYNGDTHDTCAVVAALPEGDAPPVIKCWGERNDFYGALGWSSEVQASVHDVRIGRGQFGFDSYWGAGVDPATGQETQMGDELPVADVPGLPPASSPSTYTFASSPWAMILIATPPDGDPDNAQVWCGAASPIGCWTATSTRPSRTRRRC